MVAGIVFPEKLSGGSHRVHENSDYLWSSYFFSKGINFRPIYWAPNTRRRYTMAEREDRSILMAFRAEVKSYSGCWCRIGNLEF